MQERKLNIGAGRTYIPGFVNIDISKGDIRLDLSHDRLPFDDSSVDLIFSYHTLEHIDNYLFALSEIHRVLKHGGRFLVGLPYVTLTEYHLINPYHRHNFNEFSFDFFNSKKGSAAEENSILFEKVFHRFHYIGLFHLMPPPFRRWCRRHLFNVVRKIDFGLLAIKDVQRSVSPSTEDRHRLEREFNTCLRARLPYEEEKPRRNEVIHMYPMLRVAIKWWIGKD